MNSVKISTRLALVWTLFAILFSTVQPVLAGGATPVKFAFFYKPPTNVNVTALAQTHDVFIFTRGDEEIRDQLLASGVQGPVLQYLRFEAIMDPGSCTAKPWDNQVAYKPGDFCRISRYHPDWFLLDSNGKRIVVDGKFYLMDPANPGWRQFWLQRAKEMQQKFGWRGVFLDNVEATLGKHRRAGRTLKKYPTDSSFQIAVRGFLKYLYVNYFQPQKRPLFANIIYLSNMNINVWFSYLQYLDGAMQEGWAVDWDSGYLKESSWNNHMILAEKTQSLGKFAILVSQGKQSATERQQFAYASYLLVASGGASFRYGNDQAYDEVWWYPNYGMNLGTPLGARYQVGNAWRRDFSNGYVVVDPDAHTARIVVNGQ